MMRFRDPNMARWVFVVGVDNGVILCKETLPIAGEGWRISDEDADIIRAQPGPNYTVEHFEQFVLMEAGERAQACLLLGGYIVPHYRFKLVEPPDPAACAECT
jgi:hypothetical protein